MRTVRIMFVLACLGIAGPSYSQNWTAEQQGVIDDLKECWDIFVDATKGTDPSPWLDNCNDQEHFAGYWNRRAALNDANYVRRNWSAISAGNLFWVSLDPIAIQIIDDIAIMHFYGTSSVEGSDGRTVIEDKRTEIFHRHNGRWLLVAGHRGSSD